MLFCKLDTFGNQTRLRRVETSRSAVCWPCLVIAKCRDNKLSIIPYSRGSKSHWIKSRSNQGRQKCCFQMVWVKILFDPNKLNNRYNASDAWPCANYQTEPKDRWLANGTEQSIGAKWHAQLVLLITVRRTAKVRAIGYEKQGCKNILPVKTKGVVN